MVLDIKASKGVGPMDSDSQIVKIVTLNDPKGPEMKAPPRKRNPKGTGNPNLLKLDNRTPWFVRVYVDGAYHGMLPPWGDLLTYALPAKSKVYAVANFLDGTRRFWGPRGTTEGVVVLRLRRPSSEGPSGTISR